MTARRLLRLYPRAWRARYGEELQDLLGDDRLRPSQIVDVVSGAIDAWLSADVRRASQPARARASRHEGAVMLKARACERPTPRVSTRDSLIGAAVMVGLSLALTLGGVAARNADWLELGHALTSIAFPVALTVSMPFWLLKGQPRKAQAALVIVPIAILTFIAYLNA